jgi:hypothetical protein
MKFGKREQAPQQPNPPRPVRVMAGGHDVTDKMPQTAAELERQRPNPPRPEPAPTYVQTNDDPLALGGPIPRTVGRVADLYRDIRELRLSMEKEAETVKARESELKEYIINNLSKSDDTGAAGLRYRAQIVMKVVPRAADWPKVHAFIQETGRFDLLQKRLGEAAVKDMWDNNETVPGVEKVSVPDVSITKI